jgi:hypothetical protein
MSDRADQLLARAWLRANKRLVETEGFLEDALTAALEDRAVWPHLVEHLGWQGCVPTTPPRLRTQVIIPGGRLDICLDWPNHPSLALELKVHTQAGTMQVEHYLRAGYLVATIARLPGAVPVAAEIAHAFLGSVTW